MVVECIKMQNTYVICYCHGTQTKSLDKEFAKILTSILFTKRRI